MNNNDQRIVQEANDLDENLDQLHRQAQLGLTTATIAHEINNLLTPIASMAQLALLKPDRHDLVEKALMASVRNAQQAGRVMEALLGYGAEANDQSTCQLSHCVDSAILCLSELKKNPHITLKIDIPSWQAQMPTVHLQQVFYNLLSNAYRASPDNGGEISIGIADHDTQTRNATIHVTDNGSGIPSNIQDELFTPFRKGESGGSGLGLYLSRKVMREHGGDLWLEKSSPNGTTFAIKIIANNDHSPKRAAA